MSSRLEPIGAEPRIPTLWSRIRQLLRPPRGLKVTPSGRTYLIVTLGVGLGALNTGNNLLYLVLGLLLTTIIVSGVLSERALRGLSIRRLGADAAYAQEPFAYRWALSRRGKGASFALSVAEDAPELTGEGRLAYLPAGEERIVRADLQAPRRGPMPLEAVKITTTWPLGLFSKTAVYPMQDVLLVYPRRGYACGDPADAQQGPIGDAGNPRRNDGDGDLLGLRELGETEDARRVHWLKSATAGKLLRTEREREERRSYLLSAPVYDESDRFERALEELAALTQRLISEGHEVGLDANGRRLRPASGPGQQRRILRALAWLGYDESAESRAPGAERAG